MIKKVSPIHTQSSVRTRFSPLGLGTSRATVVFLPGDTVRILFSTLLCSPLLDDGGWRGNPPPTSLLCTRRGKKAAEASQRWKKQKLPRQQLWRGEGVKEEEDEGEEEEKRRRMDKRSVEGV